jgi:6-phosphogluconate dehydrogenase
VQIGLIGLGRMGGAIARRFARGGARIVGFDADSAIAGTLAKEGVLDAVGSIVEVAKRLAPPRVVWLALPAGRVTELAVEDLWPELARGDVIVDAGNAHFRDSQRRGAALASAGVHFVDCGVAGSIGTGCAITLGGDAEAVRLVEPGASMLAPTPGGFLHCGSCGAGHFARMIHNGIEYGMMQAYAEGIALLKGNEDFAIDVAAIAQSWRHGSVVSSWLLDGIAEFLAHDADLAQVAPIVADSGDVRWAALEAVEQGVPAPVMALALMMRFASQNKADYADRLLAMMRKDIGGHPTQAQAKAP